MNFKDNFTCSKNTVTVFLFGGLGNQMFQYACAAALANRKGAELMLDTSWFARKASSVTERPYLLDRFPNLKGAVATNDQLRTAHLLSPTSGGGIAQQIKQGLDSVFHYTRATSIAVEPHYKYWSALNERVLPLYLTGYWQNEEYFADYSEELKFDFAFPNDTVAEVEVDSAHVKVPSDAGTATKERTDRYRAYRELIVSSHTSVSLHIRRGDYIADSANLGTCTPEYYAQAITEIERCMPDANFLIFSDDPQWVRAEFVQPANSTIVDWRTHLEDSPPAVEYSSYSDANRNTRLSAATDTTLVDLALMASCTHHIIANSSYSWWGAWLGESPDSIIIAPELWFPSASPELTPVPSRWQKI